MDKRQRELVVKYRQQGKTASWIAKELDVSVNTVKSYCKRHGLTERELRGKYRCEQCGAPIYQNPGRKKKRFCSDICRTRWWNEAYRKGVEVENSEQKQEADEKKDSKRTPRTQVCKYCGKEFEVPSGTSRKYCCHQCYINDRFGEKADRKQAEKIIKKPVNNDQNIKQKSTVLSMSGVTQEELDDLNQRRFRYNTAVLVFLDSMYNTVLNKDTFEWYSMEEVIAEKYKLDDNSIFRVEGPPDVRDDYEKCAKLKKKYKREKNKLFKRNVDSDLPEFPTLNKTMDEDENSK